MELGAKKKWMLRPGNAVIEPGNFGVIRNERSRLARQKKVRNIHGYQKNQVLDGDAQHSPLMFIHFEKKP